MLPNASETDTTTADTKISPLQCSNVEPAGRWFEAFSLRRRNKQTLSYLSYQSSSSTESSSEVSEDESTDEQLLLSLDPKEWRKQDHYAVLGLANLRHKATFDNIKRAYKKKVLKHHPDKRKARGVKVVKEGDDDYFTCITRAYDILGHPTKRRSFDSVDPEFDDTIPDKCKEKKFYKVFAPVFEQNSRWSNSKKKSVPQLGDEKATWEQVNEFYSFWYEFDSWREYSYLDEEEKEKGENRDERRWIEQQNKKARKDLKKEEITRVRTLVDNAYACDPRIQRFKDEEKKKKEDQKKAKKDAVRARQEEEDRKRQEAEEEERQRREKEEGLARALAAEAKKEKDAQKKAIKKEKKTMRNSIKDFDYFAEKNGTTRLTNMSELDKLAELLSLTSLQEFNAALTSGDQTTAKNAFDKKVIEMNAQLEAEKQRHMEASQKQTSTSGARAASGKQPWTDEEVQFLIKGVNLFPAGTVQRWETVASFIAQHVPSSNRKAKEVLGKAKDLQNNDMNLKEAANKQAFDKFNKVFKSAPATSSESVASERFVTPAEHLVAETGSNPNPWTAEEQKLLEQALKTFPSSTPERWDRISDCIPSRGKKDCMKRFKELAEMIKAKKAAAAAAQAKLVNKS